MKSWKFLLLLFLGLVLIKSLLVSLVPAPSMFSDEYEYAKMAQSFWHEGNFNVHGVQSNAYPPLYAVFLSPAYAFKDMRVTYYVMKLINAILSSLVIIPTYLLSRKLMGEKMALMSTIIVGILPGTFSIAPFIMSENLFLPLFMFAVYFLHKTITERSYSSAFFSGIFAALAFFTRTIGIVLIAASLAYILIGIWFLTTGNKKQTLKLPIIFTLSLIAVWLTRNFLFVASPLLQQYSSPPQIPLHLTLLQSLGNFTFWIAIYFGYIVLSTGFFPMLNILNAKLGDRKPFLVMLAIILIPSIAILARQNLNPAVLGTTVFSNLTGRPIGRYLEHLFPLVIIGGLATFEDTMPKKKSLALLTAVSIIAAIFLSSFTLFPVNNNSLSIAGALKIAYESLFSNIELLSIHYFLFTALIAGLTILAIKHMLAANNKRALITSLVIFLAATNMLNYAITTYNSERYWYNGEQMQLGLWINDHEEFSDKTFLIDERDEGKIIKTDQRALYEKGTESIPGAASIIGFWLTNPIKIRSVDDLEGIDYVLSRHEIDLPLIKKTEGNIYLYKTIQ